MIAKSFLRAAYQSTVYAIMLLQLAAIQARVQRLTNFRCASLCVSMYLLVICKLECPAIA